MFKKATKKQLKLKLLLEGASGSGKTYSALVLASSMGKKIAFIDTEQGSASLYSNRFEFDVCELKPPYEPERYIESILEAEKAGYDVIIIDSLTHEWSGQGGCLDIHTSLGGNSYTAWSKVTPRHKRFIDTILTCNSHIIATARTKTDYAMETNSKGKMAPVKLGLKTEQRDGLDFEFTVVFRLNENNMATATKDRTSLFKDYDGIITTDTAKKIITWLGDGVPIEEKQNPPVIKGKDWMEYVFKKGELEGQKLKTTTNVMALRSLIANMEVPPNLKQACEDRIEALKSQNKESAKRKEIPDQINMEKAA